VLLVDTNVVAYLLIQGDHTASAQELRRRDRDWRSEAFLLVEFTNVLASSIATNRMSVPLAQDFLAKAVSLFDGKLARMAHASVLSIAARHRVSAYDAHFLARTAGCALPRQRSHSHWPKRSPLARCSASYRRHESEQFLR
jgi:predicted nucleic acid-binding protein